MDQQTDQTPRVQRARWHAPKPAPSAEDQAFFDDNVAALRDLLRDHPPKQRMPTHPAIVSRVKAVYARGCFSTNKIADALELGVSTVSRWVRPPRSERAARDEQRARRRGEQELAEDVKPVKMLPRAPETETPTLPSPGGSHVLDIAHLRVASDSAAIAHEIDRAVARVLETQRREAIAPPASSFGDPELVAIDACVRALKTVDRETADRVLSYLDDRFGTRGPK